MACMCNSKCEKCNHECHCDEECKECVNDVCVDCQCKCNKDQEDIMSIIETNFDTRVDPNRIALGSASNITKQGAFFVFSLRVESDDVREYAFTSRDRAVAMRKVLISHMANKITEDMVKKVNG